MFKIFRKKNFVLKNRPDYTFRYDPVDEDCQDILDLVRKTGFFSEEEISVAVELIEEKLSQGSKSTYQFIFAEAEGRILGYICYGLIPMTQSSYDLYWMAVRPDCQGQGIGKILISRSEELIKDSGGTQIYAETSSRKQYLPTQKFYLRCGYKKSAYFPDFYYPGDGRIIYFKKVI